MMNEKVTFKPVFGLSIVKAFRHLPENQLDFEGIKNAIKQGIFKGNYITTNDNGKMAGTGLGIMSYKDNNVEIPILNNSLLAIVKINIGPEFKTSMDFFEMSLDTSENSEKLAENPKENLPLRVTEDILYRGNPLAEAGNKYGRYRTSVGQNYVLINRINHHNKFNSVRAVRIGDPIKLDVHKRYVIPAFVIIWNGPCKDRYGNFLIPDNISNSAIVHAAQTRGMFSRRNSK